ncbi:hypothetical protein CWI36_1310p0010 [Hamiltosporidium magnivora]|uniref:Uncharacterized protein n=1 Tax=Hamiltosporidium magnivora TaxID=148818 RepID=A0A4Q9L433_9MICR|nr:hypothetical protein CWI36_1310p0010 [Hamiltosporidium magnivora]
MMTSQANEFLGITGLERNKEKSVIKYTRGKGNDTLLEGVGVYKYLRIIEHIRMIELKSKNMLLKLMDCLETSKEISTRRLATLKRKILNDEDGVYEIKTKNIPRPISKGGTTLDGLIINISEESNLEEEKGVVQEAE